MIIIVSTPLRVVASYAAVFTAGAIVAYSRGQFGLRSLRKSAHNSNGI